MDYVIPIPYSNKVYFKEPQRNSYKYSYMTRRYSSGYYYKSFENKSIFHMTSSNLMPLGLMELHEPQIYENYSFNWNNNPTRLRKNKNSIFKKRMQQHLKNIKRINRLEFLNSHETESEKSVVGSAVSQKYFSWNADN